MPAPLYTQLTGIDAAAKTLAQGAPAIAIPTSQGYAVFVAEAQPVRWRDDGGAPTTTVGMLLTVGQPYVYSGPLSQIKFISAVAGAILNATIYAGAT